MSLATNPHGFLAALPDGLRSRVRLIRHPDDLEPEAPVLEPLLQGRLRNVRRRSRSWDS